MDKVAFVNKISTLMKATSDDVNPIPGYLYQEINKITRESDDCCHSTLEFLVDRLNKQSCHVKFKVLKLMKYLVQSGPVQFKMGLIKNSQGIRDATKYSAQDDPLHGNVPIKAVRKMAQELSQLLFNIEDNTDIRKPEQVQHQDLSRITGHGSSPSSSRGGMQGFGNSPTKTKSSFIDKLSRFATSFQDRSKEIQAEILASIESHGDYKPPSIHLSFTDNMGSYNQSGKTVDHIPSKVDGGWGNQEDISREPVAHSTGSSIKGKDVISQHIPGKAGGGWDEDDEEEEDVDQQASSITSQEGNKSLDGLEMAETYTQEMALVQSFLSNKDLPSLKDIKDFISECQNVNPEKIVELLNEHLKLSDENNVMKCLLLIEYMCPAGVVSYDYTCKTCQQQLLALSTEETSQTSTKARKIVLSFEKLLDIKLIPLEKERTELMTIED